MVFKNLKTKKESQYIVTYRGWWYSFLEKAIGIGGLVGRLHPSGG
jgi:hypothetical protein